MLKGPGSCPLEIATLLASHIAKKVGNVVFCNGMGLHLPDCMCFSLSLVITKWTLFMLFSLFFFFAWHIFQGISSLPCHHDSDRKDKDSKKRSCRKRKVLLILIHLSMFT